LSFAVRSPARRLEGCPRGQTGLGPHVLARRGNAAACRTDHGADVQVFDPDEVDVTGQTGGGLLHPVPAPVGLTRLDPGDRAFDPSAPLRTPLRTRRPAPTPTISPAPGPLIGGGITANATCQRPARSRFTRKDLACSGIWRYQWKWTQPTFGIHTWPVLRDSRRIPMPTSLPDNPEPSCTPALGGRGRKPEPHPTTLTTTTHIPRRERRVLPGLKAGVSTPRNR
jgi:hypothetical protein